MSLLYMLLTVVTVVVLAACGNDQPAASSDTGTAQPAVSISDEATTDPMDDMDHTGDHDGSENGDFAFGRPADAADADRTIEMRTGNELAFDPAEVTVAAGETVTFSITNEGALPHDFVLGDEAAQQNHADEMASGAEHVAANAVSTPPGETVKLTWTFDGDADGLRYGCHEPGHYEAGMVGTIVVDG